MKIIYPAFLIVVGFLVQVGSAQTGHLGDGKWDVKSNDLLPGVFTPNEITSVASAAWNKWSEHEIGFGMTESGSSMEKTAATNSELDSVTIQTAEVTVAQMEEKARSALQDSVAKILKDSTPSDHAIMGALEGPKGKTVLGDSSSGYLGEPNTNDALGLSAPDLFADIMSSTGNENCLKGR